MFALLSSRLDQLPLHVNKAIEACVSHASFGSLHCVSSGERCQHVVFQAARQLSTTRLWLPCNLCFGHICKHMLSCGHASSHIRSEIIMSHAIFTQSCKFSTWATIQQEHAPPGHGACILSGHKHTLFQGLAQELAEFGNISLTKKSVKHVTFHSWGNCQSL